MTKEFRQETRTKKINRWRIWRDDLSVSFQDGFVGGKMKIATTHEFDAPLNQGKANEKGPEQQAIEFMERQILLKTRKGYWEVDPKNGKYLQFASEKEDTITKFSELPQELRFYKPQNSMNTYMEKMMEAGEAMWLRKRDGCMHAYVIDENGHHRMYSSTTTSYQKDEPGVDIIARYPHAHEAMENIDLPKKSIFLGEICCVAAGGKVDKNGFEVDNRDLANGVRGAKLERAMEIQNEHGYLGFCIWDIAFWDGSCLPQVIPVADRQTEYIHRLVDCDKSRWLTYPEICRYDKANDTIIMSSRCNPDGFNILPGENVRKTLLDLVTELGWEGWVVVDPNSTYDDRTYNFRGKAERPKTCVKDKPKREADFIVRYDPDNGIGKKGKGRKSVGVGSVQAYLWHPEQGEIPVSLIGGGLDDKQVLEFADPKLYPMVWMIEFEDWTKIGSLTHPHLMEVRDDKTPKECGVEQNPNWKEHYSN